MARKKVAPEEKIVNAVGEETALGSVPADTAPPDETGADTDTSAPSGNSVLRFHLSVNEKLPD